MTRWQTVVLTTLAMLAFAGNSLLCRLALAHSHIDPASFTTVRLVAGALMLAAILRWRQGPVRPAGGWLAALALFTYAGAFSFSYVQLTAATGALLLFGAVQATMIGAGLARGERFVGWQQLGLALALGGLVALLLPGLSAPPWAASGWMLLAGIAWGVYSLLGKGAGDPLQVSAGNFLRATPLALLASLVGWPWAHVDAAGMAYAVASGALTSGVGYAIWYTALRGLTVHRAATVQLSVPALAALGGVALLGEVLTLRLVLASVAVLGGIALVILRPRRAGA